VRRVRVRARKGAQGHARAGRAEEREKRSGGEERPPPAPHSSLSPSISTAPSTGPSRAHATPRPPYITLNPLYQHSERRADVCRAGLAPSLRGLSEGPNDEKNKTATGQPTPAHPPHPLPLQDAPPPPHHPRCDDPVCPGGGRGQRGESGKAVRGEERQRRDPLLHACAFFFLHSPRLARTHPPPPSELTALTLSSVTPLLKQENEKFGWLKVG